MVNLSLDTLPIEILHRILVSGPTSNSLALSRTCRYFHVICTDPKIYVNIINNNIAFEPDSTDWSKSICLNLEKDWLICARWSLADEKAEQAWEEWWEWGSPFIAAKITESVLKWLPELLSLRHPTAQSIVSQGEGLNLSPKLDSHTLSVELITRLAFCDACRCTMLDGNERMFRGHDFRPYRLQDMDSELRLEYVTVSAPYKRLSPKMNAEMLQLRQCADFMPQALTSNAMHSIAGNAQPHSSSLQHLMLSTLLAGMLYRALSVALDKNDFYMIDQRGPNFYPPSAREIPFPQLWKKNPPPFTAIDENNAQTYLLARHIPTMTSAEFLADGEWVGYYCYVESRSIPVWDAMMHSMHFEVAVDYADHCVITSRGEDGYGPFALFGTCHKRNGWVQMTKEYDHGVTWVWSAIMTPLGIVGNWGVERGGNGHGMIWLWKKDWVSREWRPRAVTTIS